MISVEWTIDRVARVTLSRPERANALDLAAAECFAAAVTAIRDSASDTLAVVLQGSGRHFCAGGDLRSVRDSAHGDEQAAQHQVGELARVLGRALVTLRDLPVPIIAAVHGSVAGAGLAVMLSADLVLADQDATFHFAYPKVGLTPDCGLSVLLPAVLGQRGATQFVLSGSSGAQSALRAGLLDEVVTPGGLARAVDARVQAIADQPAAGPSLRMLRREVTATMERAVEVEADEIAQRFVGPTAQRAMTEVFGLDGRLSR